MNPWIRRQLGLAVRDLLEGAQSWRIWYVLGVSEVRQRYRRSTLGPFWVTLSMGIQVAVMGFILAFLFQMSLDRYIPFLCISIVIWGFFAGVINEGAVAFISMASTITQVKRPLTTYVMLTLWRNAIVFGHTVIVFVLPAALFGIVPTSAYLLVPAGLALLIANAGWMALAAAILSARFRDVPLLIQNAFTVLVWLTPVYYHPEQLGPRARLVIELNPVTSILEVARAPFLNQFPSTSAWVVAALVAICGWIMAISLFTRTRSRIAFWL